MDVLGESCVVLHCNLYRDTGLVGLQCNRFLCKFLSCAVQICNELQKSKLRVESLRFLHLYSLALVVYLGNAGICDGKLHTLVEVCKLPESCCKDIVAVLGGNCKDLSIRFEGDDCTCVLSLAHNLYRVLRYAS